MRNLTTQEVRELLQNTYEHRGASAVYDYANKHGMKWAKCKQCWALTPMIDNITYSECALCGGLQNIPRFYAPISELAVMPIEVHSLIREYMPDVEHLAKLNLLFMEGLKELQKHQIHAIEYGNIEVWFVRAWDDDALNVKLTCLFTNQDLHDRSLNSKKIIINATKTTVL